MNTSTHTVQAADTARRFFNGGGWDREAFTIAVAKEHFYGVIDAAGMTVAPDGWMAPDGSVYTCREEALQIAVAIIAIRSYGEGS
jgi:hypothetical protein